MKLYFFLTTLSWSIFIVVDSVMDSIAYHVARKWYNDLKLWHRLKFLRIGSAVATGYLANELVQQIPGSMIWYYIAFLLFWFCLWRFWLFELLIDIFAGRR